MGNGMRKGAARTASGQVKRAFHLLGLGVVRSERLAHLLQVERSLSKLLPLFASLADLEVAEREEGYAFSRFCIEHHEASRAQAFQDLFALAQSQGKRNGYFVEFGAADGVALSNTWLLEREYGWNGIVAEPARTWHRALRANRKCVIDESCIWSRSGEELLFNEVGELSTVDSLSSSDSHREAREKGRRYPVGTLSLNDLLDKHSAPRAIDYLSVDTEGSEFEILGAFDFGRYDIRVITVEHNHTPQRERLHSLLASKGFRRKFMAISRFDDWYVKADGAR